MLVFHNYASFTYANTDLPPSTSFLLQWCDRILLTFIHREKTLLSKCTFTALRLAIRWLAFHLAWTYILIRVFLYLFIHVPALDIGLLFLLSFSAQNLLIPSMLQRLVGDVGNIILINLVYYKCPPALLANTS